MNLCQHVDSHTIQKGFMRAYSREYLGDHNEFLIPDALNECYPDEVSDVFNFEVYVEEDAVHIDEFSSEETS